MDGSMPWRWASRLALIRPSTPPALHITLAGTTSEPSAELRFYLALAVPRLGRSPFPLFPQASPGWEAFQAFLSSAALSASSAL